MVLRTLVDHYSLVNRLGFFAGTVMKAWFERVSLGWKRVIV